MTFIKRHLMVIIALVMTVAIVSGCIMAHVIFHRIDAAPYGTGIPPVPPGHPALDTNGLIIKTNSFDTTQFTVGSNNFFLTNVIVITNRPYFATARSIIQDTNSWDTDWDHPTNIEFAFRYKPNIIGASNGMWIVHFEP